MTFYAALLVLLCQPAHAQSATRQEAFTAPGEWVLDWARSKPDLVLAASDAGGTRQLYVVDLKLGRWTRLTDEPAGVPWGSISPDGQWVVFLRDQLGSEVGQLYKVSTAGGKAEVLVPEFSAKSISDARWGASGRTVYFAAADRSGYGIYQYTLGASRAYTLYFSTNEISDALPSDDERFLAFTVRSQANGHALLQMIDLRTGGDAGVWIAMGLPRKPGPWASEGEPDRLLVSSDEFGRRSPGIWTQQHGKVVWLQTELSGDVTPVDWFPGGKELLLLQVDGGRTALWRYEPAALPIRVEGLASLSGVWSYNALKPPARVQGLDGRITWARVRPDGSVWADIQSGEHPPQAVELPRNRDAARPALPARDNRRPPATGRRANFVPIASSMVPLLSGWLTAPPGGTTTPRAAVIWLPESPGTFLGDDWDPLRLGLAEAGVVSLALNPRGSSGFGRAFEDLTPGEPGRAELEDLSTARAWLIREAGVTPSSVAVAGRFYGGFLALWALERQPELWAAGLSIDGIADWAGLYADAAEPSRTWCRRLLAAEPDTSPDRYEELSPASHSGALRAPLLLAHAEISSRSPWPPMRAFAANLEQSGKARRVITFQSGRAATTPQEQSRLLESLLDLLRDAGMLH